VIDDYQVHLVEEVRAGRLSRRELIRRGSVYGLSLSAIGTLLAACGADPTKSGNGGGGAPVSGQQDAGTRPFKQGGTARVGNTAPAGDFDPLSVNDGGTTYGVQMACEHLCFPRQDLTLAPVLATSWSPGSTAKEWTFKLRRGVRWHDGKPLTADDVVASFQTFSDPKGTSTALSSFAGILSKDGVEKVDDLTVRFHLDRAYADFPYLTSALNYATPILPKGYEAGDFRKGRVGTGAYILQRYVPKQRATYVRNPNYWGGKPHLDGVELTFYAEAAPMVLAMQGGELDLIPGLSYRDAQTLRATQDVQLYENPSSSYRPVHLRVDRAPFDDKRVRQALALAIDRPALVKQLLGGSAQVGDDHAFAPVFPTSPDAGAVPQRKLDVARAKQLLAQAGHGNGLKLQLTTLQYEDIPQLAVLLKQQFKAVGVDLGLNVMTESAYLGSGDNQPWLQVPMGIVYWASRGTPSQLIQPAYLTKSPWNSAHWHNPRFDALMRRFDAEADEGRRKQLAVQAAKLMQDETPALIPYWLKELRAIRKGLQGVAPGPNVVFDPSNMGFAA
jgi:peptide/nickel transport system substrate-binding protein